MSFFPRAFVGSGPSTSFHPLLRFLDEFDSYSRESTFQPRHNHVRSFNPRFDVKELSDSYELHGDLPGVDQKDVDIEFTDPQTISIRGKTEHTYTSGTPPSALEGTTTAGAITEEAHDNTSHKATVEDEDAVAETSSSQVLTGPTEQAVAKQTPAEQQEQQQEPPEKWWVSETSRGEFSRSFTFPTLVDQDAVKASLKNGVLSIIIPKKKHEGRKIFVN